MRRNSHPNRVICQPRALDVGLVCGHPFPVTTDEPQPPDFLKLLAAMAPPRVPDSAFDKENRDLFKIIGWKKSFAISVLAGLLTEPKYYANGIRLDWLQRLAFSKANGHRKPS